MGHEKFGRRGDATLEVAANDATVPPFASATVSCGIFLKAAVTSRQPALSQVLERCRRDVGTGCWNWGGACSKHGYGRVKVDRRLVSPHRVTAWAMGLIESLSDPRRTACVLHRCDNPKCVNPDHLFVGTLSDNMIDCAQKGRLHNQKRPWAPKSPRLAAPNAKPVFRYKRPKSSLPKGL